MCETIRSPRKIPGTVLLSHSQIYSTIAAGVLNYRVREGNVCFYPAIDAEKYYNEECFAFWHIRGGLNLLRVSRFFRGSRKKRWLSLTAD